VTSHFPTDTAGLPAGGRPEVVELADGDRFGLSIAPVTKRIGDATVRMLAYNRSIPGPTLKVREGSEIVVDITDEGAPALIVAEKVDLYSLDLGLLVMFNRSQPRALTPFNSADAGYAGAVHEGLSLLENGFTYRGGGGLKYPFAVRNRGRIKAIGVRADGALIFMSRGLASGFGMTKQVSGSGSLYLAF